MDYISTFMGEAFTPLAPDIEQIHIEDIAHALSLMCRANGHFVRFYSVAQHSINCANEAKARGLSERVQLACLLHDASEAYLSDITKPVKKHLSDYREIENRLQDVIYAKFLGLPLSDEESSHVHQIDHDILVCEFNALMKMKVFDTIPRMMSKPAFDFLGFLETESEFINTFMAIQGQMPQEQYRGDTMQYKKFNDLWQITATEKMSNFLTEFLNVERIEPGGSVLTPTEIDKYSDVDMEIFLSNNESINIKKLLNEISEHFNPVFGYEIISHDYKDAIRLCIANGQRYDLIFRYPSAKEASFVEVSLADKVDNIVNQFWFMAFMIIVKLGRKDNLIAAHLSLELCQLLIVIQLLVRDEEKKTNIHRFGDDESVPILHDLTANSNNFSTTSNTTDETLALVYIAAKQMDGISANFGHASKIDTLNSLMRHFLPSHDIPTDEQEIQKEISYYNEMPCEFNGFIEIPTLVDGDMFLICTKKSPGNTEKNWVPSYDFAICKGGEKIGEINLRIGYTDGLYYGGHIGYGIDEQHRGNNYASRACKLLLPIAKAHSMKILIITNNHDNIASQRVCEKLGTRFVRVARLPEWTDMYQEGERYKNIYEWHIG